MGYADTNIMQNAIKKSSIWWSQITKLVQSNFYVKVYSHKMLP